MTKILSFLGLCLLLSACQSLTYQEQRQLSELQYKGISVDRPLGDWENLPAR